MLKCDEPQKHAKRKKPDITGHVLYDSITGNVQHRQIHEDRKQMSGCHEMGVGKYKVSFWVDGKVLELNSGNDYTKYTKSALSCIL